MSDEFEPIGAAIEGSLVAKAVDGDAGENHQENEITCLNCSAAVIGKYCSNCGQTVNIHRSFKAFLHDILHGVLHFEGKFWRTLPLLVWRPGKLTSRYVRGERAKFISPMALFLFSIFMMFAVFSFIGSPFSAEGETTPAEAVKAVAYELEISNLTKQLNSADGEIKKELEEKIAELRLKINALEDMQADEVPSLDLESQIDFANKQEGGVIDISDKVDTGSKWWDAKIVNAFKSISANPDLVLYKLKANGYKFAWLLIPISIPFVWLAMIGRRGWHLYDHAVFACYSISFMSLLFIFCSILNALNVSDGIIALLMLVYPPFHMFRQLRNSYQMSGFETLLRFIFLLIFSLLCLGVFFSTLLTMGVLD